jgi:hypothetical protein
LIFPGLTTRILTQEAGAFAWRRSDHELEEHIAADMKKKKAGGIWRQIRSMWLEIVVAGKFAS